MLRPLQSTPRPAAARQPPPGGKRRLGAARRLLLSTLLLLCSLAAPAQAQIRIGQTAGHSGTVAATVREATEGARLVFEAVNARGGIGGQKLELMVLDDAFDPQRAADNARALIDKGVIALFLTRGTPHNQRILPLLAESRLALIGPSTGAMLLHDPVNPWVFNVRATYQREAERLVRHLLGTGATRIAIVQVDDSFGQDAAAGALRGFGGTLKPVVHDTYDRTKPRFDETMRRIDAANVQAVLFLGSGTAVVEGMQALRATGSRAQMMTLSNNASAGFVKALGEAARGVVVSQVFPGERAMGVPMVKEAHTLAKARGVDAPEVTPALLEGVAAAKVLVEGLRRAAAAGALNRVGLQKALDGLRAYDLGGLELGYSSTDHTGLEFSELSIVGPDGRFKR